MKRLLAFLLVLTTTVASASATLYPRNTQFAEMKDGWYATVDFDYWDNDVLPAGPNADVDSMTLPSIDLRYTFDEKYRIGVNIPVTYGSIETGAGATAVDSSAFGFGKLGLTLEAQVMDRVNVFFNQEFPFTHNNNLTFAGTQQTFDSYTFATGFNIQREMTDEITWFGEFAYRYDDLDGAGNGAVGSLVYNNAWVWDRDSNWFNPSLELTGRTTWGAEAAARYTDLRLIPGWVARLGDDDSSQFRVGFPIGMNPDSPDFGVQAGFYTEL